MASALARSIIARRMYTLLGMVGYELTVYRARARIPCLGLASCPLEVRHARNESHYDGGRYCIMEEEGGRVVRGRGRASRDSAPPFFPSQSAEC